MTIFLEYAASPWACGLRTRSWASVSIMHSHARRNIMTQETASDWHEHGVRVVAGSALDLNTPQTAGMTRAAAITHARTGASKLWAGTMVVQPDAKTGPHHHGELETVLYVVKGRVRMRWGDQLEFSTKPEPEILFTFPRMCRTRRLMLIQIILAKP